MGDVYTLSTPKTLFNFRLTDGGDVFSVPTLTSLSVEEVDDFTFSESGAIKTQRQQLIDFKGMCESFAPGSMDGVTHAQLVELFGAWANASKGVTMGES